MIVGLACGAAALGQGGGEGGVIPPAGFATGTDGHADTREPLPPKPPVLSASARAGIALVDVPVVMLERPEMATVFAEDEAQKLTGDRSRRYGMGRDLAVGLPQGSWRAASGGGGAIWAVDLHAPGAYGLRLHFLEMNLPAGAEVSVYGVDDPERIAGPYTGTGILGTGEFWSPTRFGETVRVELFVPTPKPTDPPLTRPFWIAGAQYIYRSPAALAAESGLGNRVDACHKDPTCETAWTTLSKAIAGIGTLNQNSLFCSGQLLATTAADQTPYYLTANHCVGSAAAAANCEVYWNYGTSTCGGGVPALSSVPQSAVGTLLSNGNASTSSDFSLLMIEGAIPNGLSWAGWTTDTIPNNTPAVCIHHPDGSWKRLSYGFRISGQVCGGSSTRYVRASWETSPNRGVTEGGSSGSGFFRASDQRLFGQLLCGFSYCATPADDDDYGAFAYSYANSSLPTLLAAGSDDAREPNDSCAASSPTPPGTYSNLIVKSTDEDWYLITLQAGQQLSAVASFNHVNGDIDTQLFSACGGTALVTSAGSSNAETINWTNTTGGPVDARLRVYLYSDTRNSYSLSITVTTPGPANDACASGPALALNTPVNGSTVGATTDGSSTCGASSGNNIGRDAWFRFFATQAGIYRFETAGSALDTVLSLHTACPGTTANQIDCNDDVAAPTDRTSRIDYEMFPGELVRVRVSGYNTATGTYTLRVSEVVSAPPPGACCTGTTCTIVADAAACSGGSFAGASSACGPIGNPTTCCRANWNGADGVNADDIFAFLNDWFNQLGGAGATDINASGTVDADDIFAFLNLWFASC